MDMLGGSDSCFSSSAKNSWKILNNQYRFTSTYSTTTNNNINNSSSNNNGMIYGQEATADLVDSVKRFHVRK
jgi:hypothetical protein